MFCGRRVPFGHCVSCGAIPVSQDPDHWGEEESASSGWDTDPVPVGLYDFVSTSACVASKRVKIAILAIHACWKSQDN